MVTPALKAKHDELLGLMPEGASHDTAACEVCLDQNHDTGNRRVESVKTYNEEELAEVVADAIAAAKAPLEAKVAELTAADAEDEKAKAVAEAVAPLQAELDETRTKLENAELAAETATKERDDIVAFLAEETAKQEAAEAATARKGDRVAAAKEAVPAMSDEYVAKYADRWAELSDEDFESRLAELAEISNASPGGTPAALPSTTALQTSRETSSGGATSATKELMALRGAGVNVRSIPDSRGV